LKVGHNKGQFVLWDLNKRALKAIKDIHLKPITHVRFYGDSRNDKCRYRWIYFTTFLSLVRKVERALSLRGRMIRGRDKERAIDSSQDGDGERNERKVGRGGRIDTILHCRYSF